MQPFTNSDALITLAVETDDCFRDDCGHDALGERDATGERSVSLAKYGLSDKPTSRGARYLRTFQLKRRCGRTIDPALTCSGAVRTTDITTPTRLCKFNLSSHRSGKTERFWEHA